MTARLKRGRQPLPPWKAPKDYRIVCDCQRHAARQRSVVGRTVRGVRLLVQHIRRHAIPIALSLPLAFSARYPIDAMNIADGLLARSDQVVRSSELQLITPGIRRDFLSGDQRHQSFTVEVAKEEFFRTEVPYGSLIYEEAKKNGLAPELLAAVIEAESDFRPRLRSNKDARGLMQIVPETGRMMGARDLMNPHENVRAGARYLRYLCDRYEGNMKVVLAAYNAGEGNVARFGGVPPFRETRDYVQRVSTNKLLYQRRIGHQFVAATKLRGPVVQ